MLITRGEEVTKQGFCKILWRKLGPSSGKSLLRIYSLKWVGWGWALIWVWLGGGGGGRLLTFSAFRMGAYSRWALIQGWALIRINTVYQMLCFFSEISFFFLDILSGGCGSVGGFYREITHKFIESFSWLLHVHPGTQYHIVHLKHEWSHQAATS